MRGCFASILAFVVLPAISGCIHSKTYFILKPSPDDVELAVRNLRYDATDSGYTFGYNPDNPRDPRHPTRFVYLRKDLLVATRALPSTGYGADFTTVWLRRDWDEPLKPVTPEELEKIQSLPARHPGR